MESFKPLKSATRKTYLNLNEYPNGSRLPLLLGHVDALGTRVSQPRPMA